tara:strand:+ start:2608 stop:4392 length:1785 start_codon:yes stop_codon:yes gene_type:complete
MSINYTPQLVRSPIFYKAAQALGEKFVYSIFIYTGHHTTNKPTTATYTITKDKLADVVELGTITSKTSSKLVDTVKLFSETVEVGDLVFNTTQNTIAIVSAIDNDTTLSLDTDIFPTSGTFDSYKIFSKSSASIEIAELIRDFFKTEYYNLAVDAVWCDITTEVQIVSGTATATTSNKLVDSTATFIRQLLPSSFTVTAKNTTDNTSATVSAVDSDTTLSLNSNIFESGEKYTLTVTATASNNTPWINLDGYGFFKDGINPGSSILTDKQVLMTNSTIYFKQGKDIIIPVYAPNQSTLTFSLGGVSNVFWNSVDEFWNTYENTWGNIITPIKITDGAVKDSGTATGTTTNKLVDSNQNFLTTVKVGMTVYNSTDKTVTNVTAVDSDTQLTLADNIMATGEVYQIQDGRSSDKIQYVVISQTSGFTGGTVTVTDGLGKSLSRVITLEEIACTKYTPFRVIFYNRFGALQDIIFSKKSVRQLQTKFDKFKRSTINFNEATFAYDKYKAQKQRIDIQGEESITLNTDFLEEEISDPIQELLMSQQIWIDENIANTQTSVSPVIIKTSDVEFKTSVNNKLVNYTIDFEFANDKIQDIR